MRYVLRAETANASSVTVKGWLWIDSTASDKCLSNRKWKWYSMWVCDGAVNGTFERRLISVAKTSFRPYAEKRLWSLHLARYVGRKH